jgi:hypothetical protein
VGLPRCGAPCERILIIIRSCRLLQRTAHRSFMAFFMFPWLITNFSLHTRVSILQSAVLHRRDYVGAACHAYGRNLISAKGLRSAPPPNDAACIERCLASTIVVSDCEWVRHVRSSSARVRLCSTAYTHPCPLSSHTLTHNPTTTTTTAATHSLTCTQAHRGGGGGGAGARPL